MMATGKEPFDTSGVLLARVAEKKAVPAVIQPLVAIGIKEVVVDFGALSQGVVVVVDLSRCIFVYIF